MEQSAEFTGQGVGGASRDAFLAVLSGYVSPINARSIYNLALRTSDNIPGRGEPPVSRLVAALAHGLSLFCTDATGRQSCLAALEQVAGLRAPAKPLEPRTFVIQDENGVVEARVAVRSVAAQVGFGTTDQSKIATVVSELARNIIRYAQRGEVTVSVLDKPRRGLRVVASDQGPGIPHIDTVLSGRYRSKTGLGLGILGCKRLTDEFDIRTKAGEGTLVTVTKYLQGGR